MPVHTHTHTGIYFPPRCCCSVAKLCWTLCDPMYCSISGSPVLHYLLRFMSTESIMLSNCLILCYPLLLLPSIFPNIRVFSNESVLCIRRPKYWSFSFSTVLPVNIQELVWYPCSPRDSQESSATTQFKSINSSVLSFLYGPTLPSIHDYWKNHSFDYTLCQ